MSFPSLVTWKLWIKFLTNITWAKTNSITGQTNVASVTLHPLRQAKLCLAEQTHLFSLQTMLSENLLRCNHSTLCQARTIQTEYHLKYQSKVKNIFFEFLWIIDFKIVQRTFVLVNILETLRWQEVILPTFQTLSVSLHVRTIYITSSQDFFCFCQREMESSC